MLAENLKALRKKRKINQVKLAEILGTSQATITFWETGKRVPDVDMLCKIADYYNVTTDYLLGRTPMEIEIIHGDPPPLPEDQVEIVIKPGEKTPTVDELERRILEIMSKEFEKRGL